MTIFNTRSIILRNCCQHLVGQIKLHNYDLSKTKVVDLQYLQCFVVWRQYKQITYSLQCKRFLCTLRKCVIPTKLQVENSAKLLNQHSKHSETLVLSCKAAGGSTATFCSDASSGNNSNNEEADEEEYGQYLRQICAIPGMGHRVLVIQPDIKSGSRRYLMTTKELKLAETCALVQTLPKWKVVDTVNISLYFIDTVSAALEKIVRTDYENTQKVFGSGNFETLIHDIKSNDHISAVVIGIDRLTGLQINTLQSAWGLPVYDRYTIVLQIFKDHAQSPEAKLQVALAEIPYVRSRLVLIHGGFDAGVSHLVGGATQMDLDRRRFLLQRRETKLKKQLETLHDKRQEIRRMRIRNSVPTVAVVGYTNSGKTTLIKALTEDQNLIPQNQLFATLDVSAHDGLLASLMKVTYIDTVGFISDMPITLLDAFRATLEDAIHADVIIHIRDASHPDRKLQVVSVHNTLGRMLPKEKLMSMVEVYNKVDLISPQDAASLDKDILQISAVTGQGLAELGLKLEEALLSTTSHMKKTFRIPNSEQILSWLYQEAAVSEVTPDPKDGQYLIVDVIISQPAYGKFCARFSRKNVPKTTT